MVNRQSIQEIKEIESENIWEKNSGIAGIKKITVGSVNNILSEFWCISNWKEFKKYKVVINWEKAKVISNTPQLWITVKFDSTWDVKEYWSINEIDSFKILKETKKHWISRKK